MRIFSGIQPTGNIHIGNYSGAIKQWIDLQDKNECLFCVVDLHAITTPYDPETFQKMCMEKAIVYLAAGIDPEKAIIFLQSSVKEHSELCWLLNTVTPLGELYRMTQYKEKSQKHKENAGILNYPVLMAADILLYDTEVVPVGEDQKQHVELAKDIARRFNSYFGETFTVPKVQILKTGARVMSLSDPTKKMSKSDDEDSYISLFDSPEKIRKKISRAVTDTGKEIKYDKKNKPGISNLLSIYSIFSEKKIEEIEKEMKDKSYKDLKDDLASLLTEKLEPFRRKKEELSKREIYVQEILKKGAERARVMAEEKMEEVRKKVGLQNN